MTIGRAVKWGDSTNGNLLVDNSDASGDKPIHKIVDTVPTQEVGAQPTITSLAITTTAQSLNGLLVAANGAVKSGRTAVELQNLGSGIAYVGPTGVTAGAGRKIDSSVGDGTWQIPLGAIDDVYIIGDIGLTLIVTEI